MARKRKPETENEPAPVGHNSEKAELSDTELRALAFQHRDKYRDALTRKKTADADLKNVCKTLKADLGPGALDIIKDLIALEEPEGEDAMRESLQRKATALRWAGLPLGEQIEFDLGQPDRMPAVDRAYSEGFQHSVEGKAAKPSYDPSTPQYRAFMDGFQEHQKELLAKVGRGNGDDNHA